MPNSLIKKIHEQTGAKTGKLEHEYQNLETEARKNKASNEYAYATSVIERMHGYKPENKSK